MTYSGCSCLPTWFDRGGEQYEGTCAPGTTETRVGVRTQTASAQRHLTQRKAARNGLGAVGQSRSACGLCLPVCVARLLCCAQRQPWCLVDNTTCQLPPASQQRVQRLLNGLVRIPWDVCIDRNATGEPCIHTHTHSININRLVLASAYFFSPVLFASVSS